MTMNAYDIIKLQNIAYVNSQIIAANIMMESIKAANAERERGGFAQAYTEDAFAGLIDQFQLGHNAVVTNLHRET